MIQQRRKDSTKQESSNCLEEVGPYLSERQWGTVREDYSEGVTHGISSPTIMPARAPTLGEDGIAGISTTSSAFASAWPLERKTLS